LLAFFFLIHMYCRVISVCVKFISQYFFETWSHVRNSVLTTYLCLNVGVKYEAYKNVYFSDMSLDFFYKTQCS
jgi:hypothetical protein